VTISLEPVIKECLTKGLIVCPKCKRQMDELDYAGRAVDSDGEHDRFRCRICYPTSLPN